MIMFRFFRIILVYFLKLWITCFTIISIFFLIEIFKNLTCFYLINACCFCSVWVPTHSKVNSLFFNLVYHNFHFFFNWNFQKFDLFLFDKCLSFLQCVSTYSFKGEFFVLSYWFLGLFLLKFAIFEKKFGSFSGI